MAGIGKEATAVIVRPITVREAMRVCARLHRRHPELHGAMWALALLDDNDTDVLGIASVGRPPRTIQNGARRLVVTRVAVGDLPDVGEHAASGCSMLYGACARASRAMGATDMWTYLHEDEPGSSVKGAGWICDGLLTDNEHYDRPSRKRGGVSGTKSGRKRRWWAPWSELLPEMLRRAQERRAA